MTKVLNIRDIGYKIPKGAVYVARGNSHYGLPNSKWGNPMTIKEVMRLFPNDTQQEAQEKAVKWYWQYLEAEHKAHGVKSLISMAKRELIGKDLVCWCAPLPCHADILLELVNK